MWLFTTVGFFSVVQKHGDEHLTVRARARADLERLRHTYLPGLSPTTAKAGTDYPYRACVSHEAFADAVGRMIKDIEYANFKSEVHDVLGGTRASVLMEIWGAARKITGEEKEQGHAGQSTSPGLRRAYGGVLIDGQGRVLLRKARGGFGGYGWTFAKGGPHSGETSEQTALREVLAETGIVARIRAPLPGEFQGDTSVTEFFLMEVEEDRGHFDSETEQVGWFTFERARELIGGTPSVAGRRRDLAVLEAAGTVYASFCGRPPAPQ